MLATDVMTTNVITVTPDTEVREIAALLLDHRISGVPVVGSGHRIVGIVSEGDLMRRPENETESRQSWWLDAIMNANQSAEKYVKAHARKAGQIMTRNVVTISEETPLDEIAGLLEKHHIKRVPVVRDGKLVGIVSRANLLHGLVAGGSGHIDTSSPDDQSIRESLMKTLADDVGLNTALVNAIVRDGVVQLWGVLSSAAQREAAEVAAENTPGVKAVENHLGQTPMWAWS
jgi:CBS domain-containing protein